MERLIHSEYSFYDYAALIVAVSFLGFCLENLWMLFRNKQMDNRNMNFPFLLGYGLAILLIYFVLGIPTKENVLRFYITPVIPVFSPVSDLLQLLQYSFTISSRR